LREAGIDVPEHVSHIGVDFERGDLVTALRAAGLDTRRPVVVMWLGVVPYLTRQSVTSTLRALGSLSCVVVADYRAPLTSTDPGARGDVSSLERRVAAVGEPLTDPLPPQQMWGMLGDAGFCAVDDLDRPAIRSRLLGLPPAGDSGGGHIVVATTAC
jgi:O-methyltransferase involved in polyketide biosynthesis